MGVTIAPASVRGERRRAAVVARGAERLVCVPINGPNTRLWYSVRKDGVGELSGCGGAARTGAGVLDAGRPGPGADRADGAAASLRPWRGGVPGGGCERHVLRGAGGARAGGAQPPGRADDHAGDVRPGGLLRRAG